MFSILEKAGILSLLAFIIISNAQGYDVTGEIISDTTWSLTSPAPDGIYVIVGSTTIRNNATLTIMPGVVVKFGQRKILMVGGSTPENGGTLIAEGTPDQIILFTSKETVPEMGDYDGIYFSSNASDNSRLRHCVLEYGAGSPGANLIRFTSCSPQISYCTLSNAKRDALACLNGSSPVIHACNIVNNNNIGITIRGLDCRPVITNSNITNCQYGGISVSEAHPIIGGTPGSGNNIWGNPGLPDRVSGLDNRDDTICINAQYNWWGSADGPLDESSEADICGLGSNAGSGDGVSDDVDYQNWLSGPVITPTPAPPCINDGDVVDDDSLTAADSQLTFEFVLGIQIPTTLEECAADCNGSGNITAADAQTIFFATLGLSSCVDELSDF